MKQKIFYLLFLPLLLHAAQSKTTLVFTPLPTKSATHVIEDFLPFFDYIEKHSDFTVEFSYQSDYKQVVDKFTQNKIDLVLLGPLPYLQLEQQSSHNLPIISFKRADGSSDYRCVLASYGGDKIDFSKQLKVALTQPLSTCGFYMTHKLLQDQFNIDLHKQRFTYTMSHENALLSTVAGSFDLAGAKQDSAENLANLGVKILAKSKPLPNFSLVVNTDTLSAQQIATLQELILSIPKSVYSQWQGITSYGFVQADKTLYEDLDVDFETIPQLKKKQ